MPTVERKLKLDFWGTKRRFFEILILRKPGDTPRAVSASVSSPPFRKFEERANPTLVAKVIDVWSFFKNHRCFIAETPMPHRCFIAGLTTAERHRCFLAKTSVFFFCFLLFSFALFYTQTQIDAYCQPNDGGHASVFC